MSERNRPLTPEQIEKYNKIRQQIAEELPDLIVRHQERMAEKDLPEHTCARCLHGADAHVDPETGELGECMEVTCGCPGFASQGMLDGA